MAVFPTPDTPLRTALNRRSLSLKDTVGVTEAMIEAANPKLRSPEDRKLRDDGIDAPLRPAEQLLLQKLDAHARVVVQRGELPPPWWEAYHDLLGPFGALFEAFPNPFVRRRVRRYLSPIHEQLRLTRRCSPAQRGIGVSLQDRTITVRIPETLHAALIMEAKDLNTSLNQLCISKLLQLTDVDNIVPAAGHQHSPALDKLPKLHDDAPQIPAELPPPNGN